MMYSTEQVIQGLTNYVDAEVMRKLPTSGKWIVGTAMTLAMNKTTSIVDSLKENAIVKALNIVDSDGLIDVDSLIYAIKENAVKYGDMVVDVPMVGKLAFNSYDLDKIRTYMG